MYFFASGGAGQSYLYTYIWGRDWEETSKLGFLPLPTPSPRNQVPEGPKYSASTIYYFLHLDVRKDSFFPDVETADCFPIVQDGHLD